jgi:hypothetical protein
MGVIMKSCKPEYLAKALLLTGEEQERLLSRMTGKLPRLLKNDKLSVDEALAIQMELEDKLLSEWHEKMRATKGKAKAKAVAKTKIAAKAEPKAVKPAKVATKPKASAKVKVAAEPKPVAKS